MRLPLLRTAYARMAPSIRSAMWLKALLMANSSATLPPTGRRTPCSPLARRDAAAASWRTGSITTALTSSQTSAASSNRAPNTTSGCLRVIAVSDVASASCGQPNTK
ncbi:MAG: hypothetical protein OZX49_02211 [Immundisolibacter sp.]|nr:hypothetical protein [Immundisolibacter sp.]